jgi:hypothetical protein
VKRFAFLLPLLALAACTDPEGAARAAQSYGFHDVKVTGHRFFGCAESDDTATGFTALNVNDQYVSGVVCGNLSVFGKSNTVRID